MLHINLWVRTLWVSDLSSSEQLQKFNDDFSHLWWPYRLLWAALSYLRHLLSMDSVVVSNVSARCFQQASRSWYQYIPDVKVKWSSLCYSTLTSQTSYSAKLFRISELKEYLSFGIFQLLKCYIIKLIRFTIVLLCKYSNCHEGVPADINCVEQ